MGFSKYPRQRGASAIGLLISLTIVVYGAYVAIQFVPQHIEAAQVETILENVEQMHGQRAFPDPGAVRSAIEKQLFINQMQAIGDRFTVSSSGGSYRISVSYDRELNLLFTTVPRPFRKTVTLQ
jgi:hypothetical protein